MAAAVIPSARCPPGGEQLPHHSQKRKQMHENAGP
jgi:hypothetical protein